MSSLGGNALPHGLGAAYWSTWTQSGGSVAESLGEGEAWIGGWDGVGLYEGNNKVPTYQSFTLHLTTHRLLLVPDAPSPPPLQCGLSHVRETQFYAGFMRSSPKVIVVLGPPPPPLPSSSSSSALPSSSQPSSAAPSSSTSLPTTNPAPPPTSPTEAGGTWTCGVCGFANPLPPGTPVPPGAKCALCGVGYAMSKSMSPVPSRSGTPAAAAASATSIARSGTPSSLGPSSPPPPSAPASASAPAPAPTQSPAPDDGQIACPACTFLNHPSLSQCEICGTALPKRRPSAQVEGGGGELRRVKSPRTETVRLSFRRGGEREAYRRLKGVLSDKVWERVSGSSARASGGERAESKLGGIDAIIKSMSLEGQTNDAHMQDAFRDLEVLMVRAGEMVRLAQSLNSKLTAAGGTDDAEATLVRSSLVRLGLPAPALTQDMVRDERAYFDGLARELGAILTGGSSSSLPSSAGRQNQGQGPNQGLMMQPGHGVIALDSVWGLWMRARGVALLPPATLVNVLPLLPGHTRPSIRRLDLPSGLTVLCTPMYAPGVFLARLVERMAPVSGTSGSGDSEARKAKEGKKEGEKERTEEEVENEHGLSIIDIAAAEGLPIGLATELVDMVAQRPTGMGIVRDDQAGPGQGGVKWYRDIISSWPLKAA